MTTPLDQHQAEIRENLRSWAAKPLLREIYTGFYRRILPWVDLDRPGQLVEIGSGIGNLKAHLPQALATDLFPHPWLDLVCDGYDLPFRDGSVSNLVLFDVFHHLEAPRAFFLEAARVVGQGGRVILFEPFISLASHPVYGLLHHEPVAMDKPINMTAHLARPRAYYAAQGNATRLFFRQEIPECLAGWEILHAEAFSAFHYLLSGGYSKPACYPARWLPALLRLDAFLSRWPRLFAARCLVCLRALAD